MLTCIYTNQKKDLESKVTYAGKVSRNRHDGPTRSPCRAVAEVDQRESIASLSVAEGRITAVTFSASGR